MVAVAVRDGVDVGVLVMEELDDGDSLIVLEGDAVSLVEGVGVSVDDGEDEELAEGDEEEEGVPVNEGLAVGVVVEVSDMVGVADGEAVMDRLGDADGDALLDRLKVGDEEAVRERLRLGVVVLDGDGVGIGQLPVVEQLPDEHPGQLENGILQFS